MGITLGTAGSMIGRPEGAVTATPKLSSAVIVSHQMSAGHGWRESGQGLIEYVLILILVAVVVIVVLITMGAQVKNMFSNVTTALGV